MEVEHEGEVGGSKVEEGRTEGELSSREGGRRRARVAEGGREEEEEGGREDKKDKKAAKASCFLPCQGGHLHWAPSMLLMYHTF